MIVWTLLVLWVAVLAWRFWRVIIRRYKSEHPDHWWFG